MTKGVRDALMRRRTVVFAWRTSNILRMEEWEKKTVAAKLENVGYEKELLEIDGLIKVGDYVAEEKEHE
jgi:hypothetical protein